MMVRSLHRVLGHDARAWIRNALARTLSTGREHGFYLVPRGSRLEPFGRMVVGSRDGIIPPRCTVPHALFFHTHAPDSPLKASSADLGWFQACRYPAGLIGGFQQGEPSVIVVEPRSGDVVQRFVFPLESAETVWME